MKKFILKHKSMILNIYIVLNLGGYAAWQTYNAWVENRLDFVEVSFTVQNLVLLFFIIARNRHKSIDNNIWRQIIALIAFFSGLFFIGQPTTGGDIERSISSYIIFASNILGAISLFNMGKSFGILIALRKVRTGGLYSVVRHPMYGTDILLRIGFLISHFTYITIILFVLSTACYVYRAFLEERFLKQESEYRLYMKKVRYRFIPFIF